MTPQQDAERLRSPLEILLEMFLLKQGLSLFEMRILPISNFLWFFLMVTIDVALSEHWRETHPNLMVWHLIFPKCKLMWIVDVDWWYPWADLLILLSCCLMSKYECDFKWFPMFAVMWIDGISPFLSFYYSELVKDLAVLRFFARVTILLLPR
jgi:hypothetical protein